MNDKVKELLLFLADCAIHYFDLDVNEPEQFDFEEWRDALP